MFNLETILIKAFILRNKINSILIPLDSILI